MRKLTLLISLICFVLAVSSTKTISPKESTTVNFIIKNPSGIHEFCVDSVLIQFTDYLGDIEVVTPLPVYPKVCICPQNKNSSCLSYATAGKAYGQSQGYMYASSNTYQLAFDIQVDPNPASSLFYPGVPHHYEVRYSYKFVNCKIGCWFENPQQESYSDMVYVYGLTQSQISAAQTGTPIEQVAASTIADAQQQVSDAFNAMEEANSTLSLALTVHCVSTINANSHLSVAQTNYSNAMTELIAAQSAYNSKEYESARYNATLAEQLAIGAKNEADMATNIIQAEMQRVGTISDKLTQANLSTSYSKALESKAQTIGVNSYEASALITLSFEYLNRTETACQTGDYNIVTASSDVAIEKADLARNLLEPLVSYRLAELFANYSANLTRMQSQLGNFSSNFSNSTADELKLYSANIRNGTFTEYLLYIDMTSAVEEVLNNASSAFTELNKTIDRLQGVDSLASSYRQELNLSDVELLLQNSTVKLSEADFNSSLNMTQEAGIKISQLEEELRSKIAKIENAKLMIELANKTMVEVSSDRIVIIGPDMSESETALFRAREMLYSQPERANDFARQARVLAIEQQRRMESMKMGIAGVVIIIIVLAIIISRINPSRRRYKNY